MSRAQSNTAVNKLKIVTDKDLARNMFHIYIPVMRSLQYGDGPLTETYSFVLYV